LLLLLPLSSLPLLLSHLHSIAVVILRLWKIFRAIHAIGHALSLHFNEMMESAEEGRKKLELERMTESIRLNVRSPLPLSFPLHLCVKDADE
jgi:hypothetical protein